MMTLSKRMDPDDSRSTRPDRVGCAEHKGVRRRLCGGES